MDQSLYVVAPLFNPCGYRTRYLRFLDFARHVRESGGVLVTVECAFGDQPFVVDENVGGICIRCRSSQMIWLKENLINLAVAALPDSARYLAWIDADVQFSRPDWVPATVSLLTKHRFVQMFSQIIYLSPLYEPYQRMRSFAWCYLHGRPHGRRHDFWFPGGAWATTIEAFRRCGGMLDRTLGAADHHMAYGLIGRIDDTVQCEITPGYRHLLHEWQAGAQTAIGSQVGCLDGLLLHHWHGNMAARQYVSRWEIIRRHQFDPYVDLRYSDDGLLEYSTDGHRLVRDVEEYFDQRQEDSSKLPKAEIQAFFRDSRSARVRCDRL